jgi:hypothetical protein
MGGLKQKFISNTEAERRWMVFARTGRLGSDKASGLEWQKKKKTENIEIREEQGDDAAASLICRLLNELRVFRSDLLHDSVDR